MTTARTPRHAVFSTDFSLRRAKVSKWTDWNGAQDEWERLDNLRRAGELDGVKFLEVRSSDDPSYNKAPHEPWRVLTARQKPTYVKLSRTERRDLIDLGKSCYGIDDASETVITELLNDPRWEHLEAIVISDYAWNVARWCFPMEAHQS